MSVNELARSAPQEAGPHALLFMVDAEQVFRLPIEKSVSIVGRATDADIKLDFPDVSRKQAKIVRVGPGRYTIEDLASSGGTFHQPQGLPERKLPAGAQALDSHDQLRIGTHEFHFVAIEKVGADDFPALVPVSGGPSIQLTGAVCRVGRIHADVNVPDPRVSTKHAIIETFGKGSVYVIDQKSANGTTVNDKKVHGVCRLEEHDVVAFAGIGYRLSFGGEAKTMIGVITAPGSERKVVGTGTLRMDERQRVVEALKNEAMGQEETAAIEKADHTGVGLKPKAPEKPSTGTYTGPVPKAPPKAEVLDDAPPTIAAEMTPPKPSSKTFLMRVGIGLALVAFLAYPYVTSVSGECRLAPGAVYKARAAMQGRIDKVHVREGQKVKKGDVLASFSDRELRYDLDKAKSAHASMKTTADKARVQREIERLQALLDLTTVRAGIDGKVVTPAPENLTNVVVAAGQELFEIDDTQRVTAEVLVPESDIGDVALGQTVLLRVYTDASETYESKVEAVMPVAEKGVIGSVVVVRASLQNEAERLIPGTTGVAKIVGQRQLGIIVLGKKLLRIVK